MYKKLTATIAATIMITALFASLGTAGGAATLDEPATATVKGGTSQKLTITVTNPSDTENVENVRIWVDGSPGLLENWVAGSSARENLLIAADNLENATPYFNPAGENLKLAEDNKKDTATDFTAAGENLARLDKTDWANEQDGPAPYSLQDNMYNLGDDASVALKNVGSAIGNESENLDYISANLQVAFDNLRQMAGNTSGNGVNLGHENLDPGMSDNLDNAAADIGEAAAALGGGALLAASENLLEAKENLIDVGENMEVSKIEEVFTNIGGSLGSASEKLEDAYNFLDNAGYTLGVAENYLTSAGDYINNVDNLDPAGSYIENAANSIEAAENAIRNNDNFLAAGENLFTAGSNLENAAGLLGDALGGSELSDAASNLKAAADNLRDKERVNLTLAGQKLNAVVSDIGASATKITSTAGDLKPATWQMGASSDDWIRFDAIKDNYLSPGGSETLTFLTDLTNVGGDYTLKIRYYKQGASDWFVEDTLALTVDNEAPTLEITVSQEGVAENNLVGNTYQDGTATVTIEASEAVSPGAVTVENTTDNLLPPLSLTTDDNITFVGSFEVGEWDTKDMNISVATTTDAVGNETDDSQSFDVDTKPPIFLDSGLDGLVDGMNRRTSADGTTFTYVDNVSARTFSGRVVDNFEGENIIGSGNVTVTIGVDGTTYETVYDTPENENQFFVLDGIALNEGLNTVTVTAVDQTGNAYSDNQDNIFIDTKKPEIEFGGITGDGYTKDLTDGVHVNDNTPKVDLTITDPGYPDTGLGVYYENITVTLDDDDNMASVPSWGENLEIENTATWDPSTGMFENVIPEGSDNTYYINVSANDNLNGNATASVKFIIDTVKPTISSTPTETTIELGTSANPTMSNEETLEITGTASDDVSLEKVEILVNGEFKKNATIESSWSATITLEEGKNKIQARSIDAAGNKNLVTYGYILSDFTGPTITIDEPSEGALLGSRSVTVKGEVKEEATSVSELSVAGETVPVATDGSFSTSVTVNEGTRTINLAATDEANNTNSESVSVTVDATRPVAEITSPITGIMTKKGSVKVQGRAYDEVTSIAEVTLNGESVSLEADGTFSKSVSLEPGTNTITLSAKDEADHYATDSVTLVSDAAEPSVSITEPEDKMTTSSIAITVKGKVTDEPPETDVTVKLNAGETSKEISLQEDGSFATTVPLSEGDTIITVSATDEVGNTNSESVTVTRTVTPWPLYAAIAAIIAIILAAIAVLRRRSGL